MNDLERRCVEIINAGGTSVSVELPKGAKIKGFGRGELLCVNSEGNRVVSYDAMKVLNAMRKIRRVSK